MKGRKWLKMNKWEKKRELMSYWTSQILFKMKKNKISNKLKEKKNFKNNRIIRLNYNFTHKHYHLKLVNWIYNKYKGDNILNLFIHLYYLSQNEAYQNSQFFQMIWMKTKVSNNKTYYLKLKDHN